MGLRMYGASFAAIVCACGSARAVIILHDSEQVNLGVLLASGSDRQVIIEDKLFTFESFASSQFNAMNFTVIGFVAGAGQPPNVGFDLTGPFGDGSPGDMLVHELNIQYTVEILPAFFAQGYRIKDARLTFNGSSNGDGSYARVDETIWDWDTNTLLPPQLSVFDIFGPPQSQRGQDSVDYSPSGYRKIEVNKDVKTFAAHVNDSATISLIRQEFSQVPAPGAVALLGLGGLVAVRRRR